MTPRRGLARLGLLAVAMGLMWLGLAAAATSRLPASEATPSSRQARSALQGDTPENQPPLPLPPWPNPSAEGRSSGADPDGIPALAPDRTAPRVLLDAKVVELTGPEELAVGLDWLLRPTQLPLINTNTVAGSNVLAALTGVLRDPQFRHVIQTLDQPVTNVLWERRGNELDWGGKQVTNARNIRLSAALGPARTGFLTEPQYRLVLRALEQRSGVEILSAPRVTTRSGCPAQVQVVNLQTVLTGINPEARVQPGVWGRINLFPFTTAEVPIGPAVNLLPVVAADGRTIALTVTPTLTEFVGYDPPLRDSKVQVWHNGVKKRVDPPLPRFRVCQMGTRVNVQDGQILVLATGPVAVLERASPEKPTPVRPGRTKPGRTVYRRLLVFVTPFVLEPRGSHLPTIP